MTARRELPDIQVSVRLVVLFLFASLIIREFLRWQLHANGLEDEAARNVATVPSFVLLGLFLWPIVWPERFKVRKLFARPPSWTRLVLVCTTIGLLMHISDWAGRISYAFFVYDIVLLDTPENPVRNWWGCQSPTSFLLAFSVSALLTPLVEEVTHRGLTFAPMRRYGFIAAATFSAVIFAISHELYTMPLAFIFGLIAAYQLQCCKTLWAPIISHIAVNTMVTLDFGCISGFWNAGWVRSGLSDWLGVFAICLVALSCWLVPRAIPRSG